VHRPLYEWFIKELEIHSPQQIEFARLNISYTMMSKRKLLELVNEKYVSGWDDPRMPTICGIRRRGYTPESIQNFAEIIGVAKRDNVIDVALLEHCIREDLNKKAMRVMAVLNPLKVIIDNYPDTVEELDAINNPEDVNAGSRKIPFSKVLYIERDDFMEEPSKKYFRLSPGSEVRLRYAYFIRCESFLKDENGEIIELHCSYDAASRGGNSPDGRKVKGTIHWVAADTAVDIEVRLFDRLFNAHNPEEYTEGGSYKDNLNLDSLKVIKNCKAEPCLKDVAVLSSFQFERLGYFCADQDSTKDKMVFNRTVSLKDSWAKIEKKEEK
jgi:glutaminyl-tRNA synthetase